MRRALLAWLCLILAGAINGCDHSEEPTPVAVGPAQALPTLRVTTVASGLDHPWDVRSLGSGRLLVTERDRARLSIVADGRLHPVAFTGDRIWVSGETGLLGLAVDPRFRDNHRIYTCQGWLR